MRVTHWALALLCVLFSFASSANVKDHLQQLITSKENTVTIETPTPSSEPQYGLAFIFSSTCEYCVKFAPTAEAFAAQYELPIYPFSVDGKPLHTFSMPLIATQDILLDFFKAPENVIYPALFLVNLDNRKHIPLTLGNTPYAVLVETYNAALNYPHLQARLH